MEHKKIIKFTVSIVALTVVVILMTLSDMIPYPFNTYVMMAVSLIMLLLTAKFIYDCFNGEEPLPSRRTSNTYGKEIFLISPYRTTILSIIMIVLPPFLMYIVVQLFPEMIEEVKTNASVQVIIMLVLSVILFIASTYCFFQGVKLFVRRKKIVQLIIDDDSFEFFPIYDFGIGPRNISAFSMFFRTKMKKAYFTDQVTVEKVTDRWQGDKIRIKIEGVGFYLPFLYNDANELEAVYQGIRERLERKL